MNRVVENLQERYAWALRSHLRGPSETSLMAAYEAGREALESGFGVTDVVGMHGYALAEALGTMYHDEIPAAIHGGAGFLIECLAPYEMALRGFQVANEELRELSQTLERQVEERTRDLTESFQLLQRADEERRVLRGHLANAYEEERGRIAQDLHDDTVQVMTAIAMRFAVLRRRVQDPGVQTQFDQLERAMSDAIGRCRNLLFALSPASLHEEGLGSALSELLERLADEGGFAFSVTGEDPEDDTPAPTRLVAYRIAQEALVNARKHARAENIGVDIRRSDGGLLARVTDDGVGFDLPKGSMGAPGHLGLPSMRERAELAGGWLRIESTSGRGTVVRFWLPDIHEPDAEFDLAAGGSVI
jgi:signal transduction histidine kinase